LCRCSANDAGARCETLARPCPINSARPPWHRRQRRPARSRRQSRRSSLWPYRRATNDPPSRLPATASPTPPFHIATTTVFSQRSMWWFEASARPATSKGQPHLLQPPILIRGTLRDFGCNLHRHRWAHPWIGTSP
jgi:hypothetical protein